MKASGRRSLSLAPRPEGMRLEQSRSEVRGIGHRLCWRGCSSVYYTESIQFPHILTAILQCTRIAVMYTWASSTDSWIASWLAYAVKAMHVHTVVI